MATRELTFGEWRQPLPWRSLLAALYQHRASDLAIVIGELTGASQAESRACLSHLPNRSNGLPPHPLQKDAGSLPRGAACLSK